jgi:hypothetical protein
MDKRRQAAPGGHLSWRQADSGKAFVPGVKTLLKSKGIRFE